METADGCFSGQARYVWGPVSAISGGEPVQDSEKQRTGRWTGNASVAEKVKNGAGRLFSPPRGPAWAHPSDDRWKNRRRGRADAVSGGRRETHLQNNRRDSGYRREWRPHVPAYSGLTGVKSGGILF